MYVDIKDQVALVTGSVHRVGKAIALELARRGAHMLVHYFHSSDDTVNQTLGEIRALGVEAHPFRADIGTQAGVDELFAAVESYFGRLNILVNSASNFQKRTLMEVTLDEWNETMAINMTGPFLCTQAAARLMHRNTPPGGAIVNICDRGSVEPWPEYAHHGISKAGLYALTQVSAVSLAPEIRTNAIIPGAVLMPDNYDLEKWKKNAMANIPVQRAGSAEDVARAVTYLVSEDFLNGAVIRVDGGEYWK